MYHNNATPKWKDMALPPGRTVYAIDHQFRKFKQDYLKMEAELGNENPTPGAGSKAVDGDNTLTKASGKKRQRASPKKKAPKDLSDEEEDKSPVKKIKEDVADSGHDEDFDEKSSDH
jgi:hypothetical protein